MSRRSSHPHDAGSAGAAASRGTLVLQRSERRPLAADRPRLTLIRCDSARKRLERHGAENADSSQKGMVFLFTVTR